MSVRIATSNDIEKVFAHNRRHFYESGRDGDIIFTPLEEYQEHESFDDKAMRWQQPCSAPDWERYWVIEDKDKVFASLSLRRKIPLSSAVHRAILGMGIERAYRGQGYGSQLLHTALDWAKAQPELEWVDLYVFANNLPALNLYRAFGFTEIGRVEDYFRVHGQKITDIQMTLNIRR